MLTLMQLYGKLLDSYGHQGWWPIIGHEGNNPTKTGSIKGYHPKDYSFPRNDCERFEICIGAILTQNTNWANVEKSLINLCNKDFLSPQKIIDNFDKVRELIKPSGYYNIKAKYLLNFSRFYFELSKRAPARNELLAVKGIGRETADSILLYAYNEPIFVVDAYTKRLVKGLGLLDTEDYETIRAYFEANLPRSFEIFSEFHALIVEHAKHYYSKKPYRLNDFLK